MEFSTESMNPHRRYNPLRGEWVLVSPHRTKRPWQGQVEKKSADRRPEYDPKCYLCPGNDRAGDARNPEYESTNVFTNDFAALLPDTEYAERVGNTSEILKSMNVQGTCRVVCFSPRHDLTLAEIDVDGIEKGQRVLIVDDLLATGGTAVAAGDLVRRFGGQVVGFSFLIELTFLNGREGLQGAKVYANMCF